MNPTTTLPVTTSPASEEGMCDACAVEQQPVTIIGANMYAHGKSMAGKKVCASCSKLWLNVFELAGDPIGQLLLLVNNKLDRVLAAQTSLRSRRTRVP